MFQPYYDRDGITIYHGDCLEVMKQFEDKSFDLCLADPPYQLSDMGRGGVFGNRPHITGTKGFTDMGVNFSFLQSFENWFCFCSRQQLAELLTIANNGHRWNLITWCKPNPVPTVNNKYLPDVEYIVHGFNKGRLFGDMSVKSCYILQPCGNKETEHPNEKPISIINKLLVLGTRLGESIIDPFMGSGTTLVAAKKLGRRAVGIEISEKYCEIAVKRIEAIPPNLPFEEESK